MKKNIFLLLIICLLFTGCINNKKQKEIIDYTTNEINDNAEDELLNIFNTAKEDYDLEFIAPLGEQVVAGKNYMFLSLSNGIYEIVVIYQDLQGNSKVTNIKDFDYSKYINKNIEPDNNNLSGGWYVNSYDYIIEDESIKKYFDKSIDNIKYTPIIELENNIILCYGENIKNNKIDIYLVTMNDNLELLSSAYINLSDYTK